LKETDQKPSVPQQEQNVSQWKLRLKLPFDSGNRKGEKLPYPSHHDQAGSEIIKRTERRERKDKSQGGEEGGSSN